MSTSPPRPNQTDSDVSTTRHQLGLAPGTPPRCLYLQSPSSCFPSQCEWGDGKRRLSGTIEAARRRKRSIRPASCRCLFICPVILSRENAFSLFSTNDKTRRAVRTQAGGVSDSARHHFKPPICRIRRNRTKLVSSCPVAQQRSKKDILQPQEAGKTSSDRHQRIDSDTGGGPGV